MNDNDIDRLINEALRQESELPEGLSDRLERHIDRMAVEEKRRSIGSFRKRSIYLLSGMAASLLLAVTIFFQMESTQVPPAIADTFSDPKEAALVAQDALAFLSTQLNKGLNQASEAGKEMDRINTIVNKQFEVLGTEPETE